MDVIDSTRVSSPLTLRQLITQSYLSSRNSSWRKKWLEKVDNKEKSLVRVESVRVHKKKRVRDIPESERVHTFRIKVVNVNMLKNERSSYQTTILLEKLSLDAPVKVRCGTKSKYTKGMSHEMMKKKGICGDFYFKYMQVLSDMGLLFEVNSTNGKMPVQTNPFQEVGMCKHLVSAIKLLVSTNFFYRIDDFKTELQNQRFIERF